MKQHLFWYFTLFTITITSAQKQTVFEQEKLLILLPKIEIFYQVHFSYTNAVLKNKKANIVLDKVITIANITHTLSSQTNLKFEFIDAKNIVISSFSDTDLITICGQLFIANKPFENGTITVNNQIFSSNKNGEFKIEKIPYSAKFIISSFGIEKTILKASNYITPDCKIILLKEKKEKLDQVVIENYLTTGISKTVKKTTFNSKKLKALPGLIDADILESIHQLPGVSNISETVNSIHVRGGNSDQNLVLWNHIKTYNNSHLFGTISAFNPYVIDKVSFINKGTSAKYGERISSVIDIKSNYKVSKKIKGGAGFNLLHADAFLDIPIAQNKFSIQISGRRSYADAFKTPTFKNYEKRIFQNTQVFDNQLEFNQSKNTSWFYDYTVNAAWKPNAKNRISLNHIYTKNYLNFSALNNDKSNLYIDALTTKNEGYSLVWEKEWSQKWSHQVNTNYSSYALNYQFSNQNNTETTRNIKQNNIQDFGVDINLKHEITQYKQFNFGYQFTNKKLNHFITETNSLIHENTQNTTNGNSLYTEYQVNIPKKYLFSVGFRANKYSSSKTFYVEPRVVLQKFVTSEFSINTSLEYKSQFLSQIENSVLNNSTLENNVWANNEANNLPILTSSQFTFGGNYNKNNWIIDIEAYFKKTNNIASLQFNFENTTPQHDFGNSSVQGLDLFIKKQFKNYHSWFSYTLNSNRYLFDNLNNGKRFKSNINIDNTIKWSHFYKYNNLNFSLGWVWRSGRPYSEINTETDVLGNNTYFFNALNERNLPVYHRLDFSVLYDFKLSKNNGTKYRLGISVLNLYDRKNILNKNIQHVNNQIFTNTIEATQITPNLVFRMFW